MQFRFVGLGEIDAEDDGRIGVLHRRGDDHLARAGIEMTGGLRTRAKAARAFEYHVHLELVPGQLGRIGRVEDPDRVSTDADHPVAQLDVFGEAAVDGVVLEQMRKGSVIFEIVDRDELEIELALVGRPQRSPSHSAEAVDCDSGGHGRPFARFASSIAAGVPSSIRGSTELGAETPQGQSGGPPMVKDLR